MKSILGKLFLTLSLLSAATHLSGADWPTWRGPNYDGSTTSDKPLPVKFDQEKGVKWSTTLPGMGASTPIIIGDRIFLSSVQVTDKKAGKGRLLALCLNRANGKVAWKHDAGSGYRPGEGDGNDFQLDSRTTYASPSAVSDGERVIFFYGNGDLVSYDLEGEEQWRRNLQKDYGDFTFQWTFSATPTLYDGKLYLAVLQRDEVTHGRGKPNNPSFLLCMNPANGKTVWKHIRPSDANKESLESFGTVIPYEGAGRKELIIAGGDVLTGHDPATGKEIWRWGTWNPGHREQWWRLVPSPVVGGGVVLACAPKKAPVFAAKLGLKGTHSGKDGLVWETSKHPQITSDVPTPLFYNGKFYVLSDLRQAMSRVDPKTGKVEWSTRMPGKYKWRASPTAADGKIYSMNHNGEVVVMDPSSGEILHVAKMGQTYDDNTRSSVAISDGQLFIRANSKIFCIQ